MPEIISPISFYTRAGDVWDALSIEIENAKRSIRMEQYIMADDEAGQRFAALFARKAQQGVSVRLILDAVGSHTIYGSSTCRNMIDAGVEVRFYNEIGIGKLFRPAKWLPRNHCKNVVIDDEVAFIGSACIEAAMYEWREMHLRFTGSAVQGLVDDFDLLWRRMENRKKFKLSTRAPSQDRAGDLALSYVSSGGLWRRGNPLYKDLLQQIARAQGRVYLVTPYFMPPYRLRQALKKAAKRGVDVNILLSAKSDVRLADWAARLYYPRLMRNGIRIFHFTRHILHAKYVLVDDWVTIGSTNMDYLSLMRNREGNVILREPGAVRFVQDYCRADIDDSQEMHVADYRKLTLVSDVIHAVKNLFRARRA